MTKSAPSLDSLEWLPATTHQQLLTLVGIGGGLAGLLGLVATGRPLRYCAIGVILGGAFFFAFMAVIAPRSVRRMTANAPLLGAPPPEAGRASTPRIVMERAVGTAFLVVLTVVLGNPALPGIAIGGGLGLLVIITRLTRRWQYQNHEILLVARRRHHALLPERPAYYRIAGN